VPEGLQQLLSDTQAIKLGIGIRQDFDKLAADFKYVQPTHFVDLAVVAAAYGMGHLGLKSMCVRLYACFTPAAPARQFCTAPRDHTLTWLKEQAARTELARLSRNGRNSTLRLSQPHHNASSS
jgi:hypothetical protein